MEQNITRKRKFQAEQLGIPLSKHIFRNESLTGECHTVTTKSHVPLRNVIYERDTYVMANKADYSEMESAKGSNSNSIVATDTDSLMSTLCVAETNEVYFASSSKRNSDSYSSGLYSLTNSGGPERSESIVYTHFDEIDHDFGVHLPLNIEEHMLASGAHIDGYGIKELEELINDNEVTAESSALESGEWTVDKDIKGNTKELTIDKEFENYFSAMML